MSITSSLDLLEANLFSLIQNHEQPQNLLTKIGEILGQSFEVDACLILTNQQNYELSQTAIWENQKKQKYNQEQFLKWLTSHEEIVNNFAQNEVFILKNISSQDFPFLNLAGIYTCYQSQVNGLIILAHTSSYKWTAKKQTILKKVSNILNLIFHLQESQKQNQETVKILESLTQKLRKESDQEKIFNLLFVETTQIFKADRGLVFLLKYSQSIYKNKITADHLQAKVTLVNEWQLETGLTKTENISASVADCIFRKKLFQNTPETIIINNIFKEFTPTEIKQIHPIFKLDQYGSAVLIPLLHHSSNAPQPFVILGCLVLQYQNNYLWTSFEEILVNWLSLQMSNSIIQSQSLRQVQNLVDERTAQLKWSLDVQNKLSEKMRQQIQQLQKLNELKDDFMSSMSHELNTPLATMKMAIKMLRQTGDFSEKQTRYLDILEQEWNREFNLIKDLLTLQQLESQQFVVELKEIEVEPILTKTFATFQQRWADKKLALEWNINSIRKPLKIYTDEESFTHILTELLLNAGKYSAPDSLVIFNLDQEIKLARENIILEISNCGAGISPEEIPYIFDKFRRGQGTTDQAVPGTGLGLTLVKMLVQQLNGTIEVTSESEPNTDYFVTTFTVILPRFKL